MRSNACEIELRQVNDGEARAIRSFEATSHNAQVCCLLEPGLTHTGSRRAEWYVCDGYRM